MRLFDRVLTKFGLMKASDAQQIISQYIVGPTSSLVQEKTYRELVDAYKGWVYTCIDKIGKAVAMVPVKLYVYRQGGRKIADPAFKSYLRSIPTEGERKYYLKQVSVQREEIFSHPFLSLIWRPNNMMTRFGLWYESMIRLELGGLCGWYIPKNGLGIPGEVWPLPLTKSGVLQPVVSGKMEISYWLYRDGEVQRKFPPDEIIMLKYPHPASPLMGMSPLMAQTYPYDIDLFLMQQQRSLFANMAVPGLNLTTDQKLPPGKAKELREQIDEQFAGALKAGKTMVLHSGLKSDKMAMTSREAVIRDVAEYARQKLVTSYDLSEGKLGLVEDVNRANAEALNEIFIMDCLRPKCMLIEESIEQFMLPMYDQGLTLDFQLPDLENREMALKEREVNLQTGYHSINEEREKDGEQPVPWGDLPWIPFNYMQPGKTPAAAAPKPKEEPILPGRIWTQEYWTDDRKTSSWNQFARQAEVYEEMLADPLRRHFRATCDEVTYRVLDLGKSLEAFYNGWSRKKVEAHLKENAKLDELNIDKGRDASDLKAIAEPIILHVLNEVGTKLTRTLHQQKATFDFNVNDPKVLEWLGDRMDRFSREVSGTTFAEINVILREGFAAGEPLTKIADTLRQKFDDFEGYRALMIARTEVISASNRADLFAIEQSGMESTTLKHWLSARDGACRETHIMADKMYASEGIELKKLFIVGKDLMAHPGGGKLAEENINCRCSMFYTQREVEAEKPRAKPSTLSTMKGMSDVSTSFNENQRKAVRTGLDAIDKVHGIPKVTKKMAISPESFKSSSTNGVYHWNASIGINKNLKDLGQVSVTTAHEVGHWLDNKLTRKSGIGTTFASESPVTCKATEEMRGLMKSIHESDTYKYLKDLQTKGAVTKTSFGRTFKTKIDKDHVDYLLQGRELFARAYSQYISVKSDTAAMMDIVQQEPYTYRYFWKEDEFKPILAAFDKLFTALKWEKAGT